MQAVIKPVHKSGLSNSSNQVLRDIIQIFRCLSGILLGSIDLFDEMHKTYQHSRPYWQSITR